VRDISLIDNADVMEGNATITQHTIGNVTYIVMARPSDTAEDSIDRKIEKLIIKEVKRDDF
jgi:hypothetical protein